MICLCLWFFSRIFADFNFFIRKHTSEYLSFQNVLFLFYPPYYLATSCEELTHWKRLWCWEGLGAGGKGDSRGWDGWMASRTRRTWVWVNSRRWWWTGRPGVLWFMGSQRVGYDWATSLSLFNCTHLTYMQSTSWEMLGWMKHKLESRLLGEISINSDIQMTPPLWQKVKRN